MKGFLVTLEGPEGAGKSTQLRLLEQRFRALNKQVLTTREPGGTALGEKLRSILMTPTEEGITAESELLLFTASRAQLMRKVLLPHLERGGVVLCDRFIDSTTAYQGYARGLDLKLIHQLNQVAVNGRFPDRTFVLDLDIEIGFSRTIERANGKPIEDRLEAEDHSFHQRVRQGFLEIARLNPQRVKVVDATLRAEQIADAIWREIEPCL